ncbi:MAG: hypothetical protein IK077_03245 [Thermoguttaceae bacterium]|nr:hypothetical protein [Thermoguttaceae bacterium]
MRISYSRDAAIYSLPQMGLLAIIDGAVLRMSAAAVVWRRRLSALRAGPGSRGCKSPDGHALDNASI